MHVADLFRYEGKYDRGVFFGLTAETIDLAVGPVKVWGDLKLAEKLEQRKKLLLKIEERFPGRKRYFSCASKHAAQF